ncbi:MAG TPA: cupredoxin domain-containing protein [Acetobacteraceae bacterium]|jgi:uncharacterized cupredoxin-like copper-binding protein
MQTVRLPVYVLLCAGLLCVAAFLCAATAAPPPVDWSKAQTMRVEMVDNRFVPDHLTFRHGVTYRLHLVNHGKDLHEFTAPEFFAEAMVRDPEKLANGGKDVVVQPDETADIDLVPQRPGQYDLRCADHDWDGMVGSIEVQ